jgi:hypothetical protein
MADAAVKLLRLKCVRPDDGGGTDEVKMQVNGVKVWPPGDPEGYVEMTIGGTYDVNQIYQIVGGSIDIALYDDETIGSDDRLGSIRIFETEAGGERMKDINGSSGSLYQLFYIVKILDF